MMGPILEVLRKVFPGIENTHLYKILEFSVLILLIYGVYAGASGDLSTAKHDRDEQITGIVAQVGFTNKEVGEIKEQLKTMVADDRDTHKPQEEQLKELAVDVATLQEKAYALQEKNEALTNWNKILSERLRTLETKRTH